MGRGIILIPHILTIGTTTVKGIDVFRGAPDETGAFSYEVDSLAEMEPDLYLRLALQPA